MIDETAIQSRIMQLEAERDAYIAQANAEIRAYQAAIGELQRLIAQPTEYVEQVTVRSQSHTE